MIRITRCIYMFLYSHIVGKSSQLSVTDVFSVTDCGFVVFDAGRGVSLSMRDKASTACCQTRADAAPCLRCGGGYQSVRCGAFRVRS